MCCDRVESGRRCANRARLPISEHRQSGEKDRDAEDDADSPAIDKGHEQEQQTEDGQRPRACKERRNRMSVAGPAVWHLRGNVGQLPDTASVKSHQTVAYQSNGSLRGFLSACGYPRAQAIPELHQNDLLSENGACQVPRDWQPSGRMNSGWDQLSFVRYAVSWLKPESATTTSFDPSGARTME